MAPSGMTDVVIRFEDGLLAEMGEVWTDPVRIRIRRDVSSPTGWFMEVMTVEGDVGTVTR